MPSRTGLEKGMNTFSISAPYLGAGVRLGKPRSNQAGLGINARVSALETRRRNAPTKIEVAQAIPTKIQITHYCMQDEEFARLYAVARSNGPGSSKAQVQLRDVRKRILDTLPFGPILPSTQS